MRQKWSDVVAGISGTPLAKPMLASMATIMCLMPVALLAQEPAGLARSALDHPAFVWVKREAPNLRVYFLAKSFPATHQDSLVRHTETALRDNLAFLGVETFDSTIDVFFIESRAQMDSLVGSPVTGFTHRAARAVFVVTNPEWRAFEKHEMMHVLAHHIWGPASSAWIEEGLAQFADFGCGAYTVDDVACGLAKQSGHFALDTLAARFRELDDLTAYVQAASMAGYIFQGYGRDATRAVWQRGVEALPEVTGTTVSRFTESWWRWVQERAKPVPDDELKVIRDKGCG